MLLTLPECSGIGKDDLGSHEDTKKEALSEPSASAWQELSKNGCAMLAVAPSVFVSSCEPKLNRNFMVNDSFDSDPKTAPLIPDSRAQNVSFCLQMPHSGHKTPYPKY